MRWTVILEPDILTGVRRHSVGQKGLWQVWSGQVCGQIHILYFNTGISLSEVASGTNEPWPYLHTFNL